MPKHKHGSSSLQLPRFAAISMSCSTNPVLPPTPPPRRPSTSLTPDTTPLSARLLTPLQPCRLSAAVSRDADVWGDDSSGPSPDTKTPACVSALCRLSFCFLCALMLTISSLTIFTSKNLTGKEETIPAFIER